jgi:tetratricopeptide (TPR) repeat protein
MKRSASISGYSTRDVANLLGLSTGQVRSFVQAGFLEPRRGARREFRFSFQDLVLLRAAKGLIEARIPTRRVRAALQRLGEQLPKGRSLSAVRIAAQGSQIIVRDGSALWDPESGQWVLDFEVAELARQAAPLALHSAELARSRESELDADDWYELAFELEATALPEAKDAYRRALELEPDHPDAHLNLGRLLHERGDVEAAKKHYQLALAARPHDSTAAFNLGVAFEDLGRPAEALVAYKEAITYDASSADAHYNLARLYEQLGKRQEAVRHFKAYKLLTS